MTLLNLNEFPTIENSIGLLAFNHLQEFPLLEEKGDITERIYGCYNFLYFHADEKYHFFKEGAYLRAALNEFVSISEMIKVSLDGKINRLTIENSDLPLLHFFKLLREVNFHLNSLLHNYTTSDVKTFNTATGEIDGKVITLKHTVIDNLSLSMFDKSRNIKYYDPNEMTVVIEWVRQNQYKWGIFHILDLALRQYCLLLEKHCC